MTKDTTTPAPSEPVAGPVQRPVRPLVERLRDTPNWMRESYGSWKDCVLKYDRAPFEAADELERIRQALGCKGRDSHTDPVAVVQMLRSWEVDASVRADRLEQYLRNVLEIARTWQPDYATKMDRDTLDLAAAEVGERPNAK
jgi:hypothetical protein